MSPVSTIKEIFFSASTLSTLSSELVFRTGAGGLEPRPRHWNDSRRVGLGFGGEVGISSDAPGHPCGDSTLQVWEGTRASVGTVHLPMSPFPQVGHAFVGGRGFGHALPSVLTGCIRSTVRGES